jgi:hypothetical protein
MSAANPVGHAVQRLVVQVQIQAGCPIVQTVTGCRFGLIFFEFAHGELSLVKKCAKSMVDICHNDKEMRRPFWQSMLCFYLK